MSKKQCPSPEELKAYELGQLRAEEIDHVAAHVDQCPPCGDTIARLEGEGDTMLTGLRKQVTSAVEGDSELERAMSFVKEIGREATVGGTNAAKPKEETPPIGKLREYELLEKIGEGGMGTVYKARHSKLDKIVAIKVLPAEKMKDAQAVARFEREMRAVGKLEHPNIVRAMDAGEVDGMHFLVMEYVKGLDLSQISKQFGPLLIAEACELIRQAAVGLDEAYDNDMVHRDIKPSNLILAQRRRKPPVVKILDMGLAMLSDAHTPNNEGLTTTGQMMGTLDYMAPEQGGDSKKVDIRADIYALGASLYRLLCGQVIYYGEEYSTPVQKLMALAVMPAPPIQDRQDGIPDDLAAIVHKMLEKKPEDRFATPQQIADALTPFAKNCNLVALLDDATAQPASRQADVGATRDQMSSGSVDTEVTSDHAPKRGKENIKSKKDLKPPEEEKAPAEKKAAKRKLPPRPGVSPTADTPCQAAATRSSHPPTAVPKAAPKPRPAAKVPAEKPATGMPSIKTDTPRRTPRTATKPKRNIPTWVPIAVAAGLGGIALLAAVIMLLPTKHGTVRIEITDPSIEVTVSGDDRYHVKGEDGEFEIAAGEHTLHITAGGTTFQSKQFTIGKGDDVALRVSLLEGNKVQVVEGDKVLSEHRLPEGKPDEQIAAATGKDSTSQISASAEDGEKSVGAAGPPAPFALEFSGAKQWAIEAASTQGAVPSKSSITFETWLKQNPEKLGAYEFLRFGGMTFQPSAASPRRMDMRWHGGFLEVIGAEKRLDTWNHLAAVRDVENGEFRLYFNGKEVGRKPIDERQRGGFDTNDYLKAAHTFNGQLSETALSSVARYHKDFVPTRDLKIDEHTVVLYRFAEGSGDVLKDSSGNGHHGKINGGTWVRVEETTASADSPADTPRAAVPKGQVPVSNPDQAARAEAAKGILAAGGTLTIKGENRQFTIKTPQEVPNVPFEVINITFDSKNQYSADQLPRIVAFPEVDSLNLTGPVTDEHLPTLGSLPQLTTLGLGGVEITNGLNLSPGFSSLRKLHLGRCGKLEGGLELTGFDNLEGLSGYDSSVGDISKLGSLPKLRHINLLACGTKDAHTRFIKTPPRLEGLYIEGCELTDKGLKPLAEIKTLKTLRLDRTRVTRAGVMELKKSLPECHMAFVDNGVWADLPPNSEVVPDPEGE